ncbi:ankyrin repeat domain-containing protein [Thalassoglobus sp. JC818]|uniref:ankyrin repeat domain-containing protein n=1 Tax=Thalassoglobus sp. JC818 TaxID=3232136 RepID=UPI00345AA712
MVKFFHLVVVIIAALFFVSSIFVAMVLFLVSKPNTPERQACEICMAIHNGSGLHTPFVLDRIRGVRASCDDAGPFEDRTPLHCAATYVDLEAVKTLLEAGADASARNYYDETPLSCLVDNWRHGDTDAVMCADLLYSYGASVSLKYYNGNTLLHVASFYFENVECLRWLLDHGCDIDARNRDGETALDLALRKEHSKAVAFLKNYVTLNPPQAAP